MSALSDLLSQQEKEKKKKPSQIAREEIKFEKRKTSSALGSLLTEIDTTKKRDFSGFDAPEPEPVQEPEPEKPNIFQRGIDKVRDFLKKDVPQGLSDELNQKLSEIEADSPVKGFDIVGDETAARSGSVSEQGLIANSKIDSLFNRAIGTDAKILELSETDLIQRIVEAEEKGENASLMRRNLNLIQEARDPDASFIKKHAIAAMARVQRAGIMAEAGLVGVGANIVDLMTELQERDLPTQPTFIRMDKLTKKPEIVSKDELDTRKASKALKKWSQEANVDNPTWAEKVAEGSGSMVGFTLLNYASGGSAIIPALAEAVLEGASVYEELRDQGKTVEEASLGADADLVANLIINKFLNVFELSGSEMNAIKKSVTGAGTEGLQEGMQQIASNVTTGKEWDEGVLESMAIGSVLGGVTTFILPGGETIEINTTPIQTQEDVTEDTDEELKLDDFGAEITDEVKTKEKAITEEGEDTTEGFDQSEEVEESEAVIIDPDQFKKAANDFDPANHAKYSQLAKEKFTAELKTNTNEVVKFTSGGSGSGKSEILLNKMVKDFNGIVVDGTFAKYDSAVDKMNEALDAGKEVEINAVLPDIEKAWSFAQRRGEQTGRFIPKSEFIRMHMGFVDTITRLLKEDPDLNIRFKDTRGTTSLEQAVNSEFITDNAQILAILEGVGYNKADLENRLQNVPTTEQTTSKSQSKEKGRVKKAISQKDRGDKPGEQKESPGSRELVQERRTSPELKTETDPLIKEAKKFDSAEEFVKSQGEPLLHGTTKQFKEFDLSKAGTRNKSDQGFAGRGIYLTNSREVAEDFSQGRDIFKTEGEKGKGRIVESFINIPESKILSVDNFSELSEKLGLPKSEDRPSNVNLIEFTNEQSPKIAKKAQELGFDAIRVDGGGIDKFGTQAFEMVVFDPKNIKTKEQLEDIFNESKKPSLDQDPQKKFDKEGKKKKPPVKKGKGAIFDRVYDQLKLETNVEDNFDSITLRAQAKRGTDFMEKNPKEAISIALRQKPAPKGTKFEVINMAVSKQALANGNMQLYTDAVAARSVLISRAAQSLGLERLVNSLSTDTFVQEVFRNRLLKLSTQKGFVDRFKSTFKKGGKITLGLDIIAENATAAKRKVDNKVKAKIASAQSIIDALTC